MFFPLPGLYFPGSGSQSAGQVLPPAIHSSLWLVFGALFSIYGESGEELEELFFPEEPSGEFFSENYKLPVINQKFPDCTYR